MATSRRDLLALSGAVLASLAGCVAAPGDGSAATGAGVSEADPNAPDQRVRPDVGADDLEALVAGNTAFAFDLVGRLVEDDPVADHFVSPLSVSMALAMTWAGARGDTAEAMAGTLHFPLGQADLHPAFNALERALERRSEADVEDGDPLELAVANAVWPRAGLDLREPFLDTLADHYGARPVQLDYAGDPNGSRATINRWVADQTMGRIDELVPPGGLSGNPPLVLTNAVYYLAGWLKEFEEAETHDAEFTALDGTTGTVSMMSQTETFPYATVDGHQVVELPYVGEETSMVVILPAAGEFRAFESSVDADRLGDLLADLDDHAGTVELPRFRVESSFRLSETLRTLGMEEAFSGEANFGGMVEGGGFSIAEVYHDTFVSVDEEGTEAAAATAVVTGDGGVPVEFELTVDRPFLFLIRDRLTGSVLFLGRVADVPAEA